MPNTEDELQALQWVIGVLIGQVRDLSATIETMKTLLAAKVAWTPEEYQQTHAAAVAEVDRTLSTGLSEASTRGTRAWLLTKLREFQGDPQ